jgi:hypothetical protein
MKKSVKKKVSKNSNFNRNLLIGVVIIILIFVVAFNFAGKDSDRKGLFQQTPLVDQMDDAPTGDTTGDMPELDITLKLQKNGEKCDKVDHISSKGEGKGEIKFDRPENSLMIAILRCRKYTLDEKPGKDFKCPEECKVSIEDIEMDCSTKFNPESENIWNSNCECKIRFSCKEPKEPPRPTT